LQKAEEVVMKRGIVGLAGAVIALLFMFVAGTSVADAQSAAAASCTVASAAHRTALVELYTSEGCSSCPPADDWLGRLGGAANPEMIVPLALHVTYWDSRQWRDRFSDERFDERQRDQAHRTGARFVYTPQVLVSGQSLSDWSSRAVFEQQVKGIVTQPSPVDIGLAVKRTAAASTPNAAGLDVEATFAPRGRLPASSQAVIAVYENRLSSNVAGGENDGRSLHHDYVVREWLEPVPVAGPLKLDRHVALDGELAHAPAASLGVVAFVEDGETGEVVQVARAPLCE
jgi:hypothetical protein